MTTTPSTNLFLVNEENATTFLYANEANNTTIGCSSLTTDLTTTATADALLAVSTPTNRSECVDGVGENDRDEASDSVSNKYADEAASTAATLTVIMIQCFADAVNLPAVIEVDNRLIYSFAAYSQKDMTCQRLCT